MLRPVRRLGAFRERGVLLALIVVVAFGTISSSHFLTTDNLTGILTDVTFLGIITIGVATALLAGEIDISVGSTFGLSAVVCGNLLEKGWAVLPAVGVTLAVGIGCGFANALTSRLLRIPAIIVTLATLGIYRAIALALAHGGEIDLSLSGHGFFFNSLGNGTIGGSISYLTLVFFAVAIVMGLILARTTFGFRVYSVGSNPAAARLVGIRVARLRMTVLTLSGFFASGAGVLSVAYLQSANPTGGTGYELDALAAAIIGGIALTGGSGTIFGVVLGQLIVGVASNLLVLANIAIDWVTAVSGIILLIAVGLNRLAGADESAAGEGEGGGRRALKRLRLRVPGAGRRRATVDAVRDA